MRDIAHSLQIRREFVAASGVVAPPAAFCRADGRVSKSWFYPGWINLPEPWSSAFMRVNLPRMLTAEHVRHYRFRLLYHPALWSPGSRERALIGHDGSGWLPGLT